jgi:serine/threonine protein kinase/predicted negative regulator of RcsB-dependent stress response
MEAAEMLQPLLIEATAGDYEILGELGRGGMAAVFLARDVSLNRKVAIKTMLPQFIGGPTMVARFKREAQMAAGLSHPHIVQIHSVKHTPKLVYFVMKYIEGRGLDAIIGDHGALDLDMTRMILQQASSALSFAHHRGVVHRDVKPANIMIDENGWAVVTDFGIAKADDGNNLTATGTSVGTPHYMAPEQFHAQPLTAQADQYALGIVAYEMLSGKKPFNGSTLADIIRQHLFAEPPNINADRPDLPEQVSSTITRMLAKEPAQRFPDLDAAMAAMGPPDGAKLEAARAKLVSIARSTPEKKPRLSVPMSPMPASRPSIPTTVVPQTLAERHPQAAQATLASLPSLKKKRNTLPYVVAAVLLLAAAGVGGWRYMQWRAQPENNASIRRGLERWQARDLGAAETEFTAAVGAMPNRALPHIYLARVRRERGNLPGAMQEAVRAAQLEPNNALALREAGSVFLTAGDNDRARRLFVRAVRANPNDKSAMGWLACSLQRLGDAPQAQRWAGRAGTGPWSACIP